jgi:hypothetical protein
MNISHPKLKRTSSVEELENLLFKGLGSIQNKFSGHRDPQPSGSSLSIISGSFTSQSNISLKTENSENSIFCKQQINYTCSSTEINDEGSQKSSLFIQQNILSLVNELNSLGIKEPHKDHKSLPQENSHEENEGKKHSHQKKRISLEDMILSKYFYMNYTEIIILLHTDDHLSDDELCIIWEIIHYKKNQGETYDEEELRKAMEKKNKNIEEFHLNICDFPDINNVNKDTEQRNRTSISIINESKSTYITSTPCYLSFEKIVETIPHKEKALSLFENDNLIFNYADIKQMFHQSIIYQIKLQYMEMKEKMDILEAIKMGEIGSRKWEKYREMYQYDKLLKECSWLEWHLTFYCIMNNLIDSYQKCQKNIKDLIDKNYQIVKKYNYSDVIVKYMKNIDTVTTFLGDCGQVNDLVHIKKIANELTKILRMFKQKTIETHNQAKMLMEQCHHQSIYLQVLRDKIIGRVKINIPCKYYITTGIYPDQDSRIKLHGISNHFYVDYNQPINMAKNDQDYQFYQKENHEGDYFAHLQDWELNKFFNQKYFQEEKTFPYSIFLYPPGILDTVIRFQIDGEVSSVGKCSIEIKNLPDGYRVFAPSIVFSPVSFDDIDDINYIYPVINSINDWMKTETVEIEEDDIDDFYYLDQFFQIEKKENIKRISNKQIIDNLFDHINQHDKTGMLIDDSMRESFYELAFHSSII